MGRTKPKKCSQSTQKRMPQTNDTSTTCCLVRSMDQEEEEEEEVMLKNGKAREWKHSQLDYAELKMKEQLN